MKKIVLLGASGNIGKQTLDVVKKHRDDFSIVGFSVGRNTKVITKIIKDFPEVNRIYLCDCKTKQKLEKQYPYIDFYCDDIVSLLCKEDYDMVVNALVGFVGLKPTIEALKRNKIVALANKESLVVGGELINELILNGKGEIYPIDSEHAALHKCLSVDSENVSKLVLTASGGAFRNLKRNELNNVTKEMALDHPTWKMGPKITIDCATMVNKAFEIIEAYYLFGYKKDQIGVILHDESYVHSYVEYNDGCLRLEINKPDMRNPIKYALYEGKCVFETCVADSLDQLNKFHFTKFNIDRYPMVNYAYQVLDNKGLSGTYFNASNEAAVYLFLNDKIKFLDIENIINEYMQKVPNVNELTYEIIEKHNRMVQEEILKRYGGLK